MSNNFFYFCSNGNVYYEFSSAGVDKSRRYIFTGNYQLTIRMSCMNGHSLREKTPLQNFTLKVNIIKDIRNIKVTFELTLLQVKMQRSSLQY